MKRCLIITKISYPFGGGEKYLYDTFFWLRSWNIDVCWISFTDKHHRPFQKTTWNVPCIQVRGGFSSELIATWCRFLNPDFIHTQGVGLPTIIDGLSEIHVPVFIGFHFWTHLVRLGPSNNQDILQHIEEHQLDPFYDKLIERQNYYPYVCSSFVNDVVKTINPSHPLWPVIPPTSTCQTVGSPTKQWITHINIHPLKGGQWLSTIAFKCPSFSFKFVSTEPGSSLIEKELASLPNCQIVAYTDHVHTIYEQTSILMILSLVDETYGRVAYEGLFYHIPIITTGKGNLRHLLKDAAWYVDSPEQVVQAIQQLSHPPIYRKYIHLSQQRFKQLENGRDSLYRQMILKPHTRLMFMAPYTDQGLGIQVRRYKDILQKYDHPVFIFSFRSYYSQQVDASEWNMANVYQCHHIREKIPFSDVKTAMDLYEITHVVIPETCFPYIFQIAQFIRDNGRKVIAIPNIEIVRSSEIIKHQVFHELWFNNLYSLQYLEKYRFLSCRYIGFPVHPPTFTSVVSSTIQGPLVFCCIGGMNAFSRKQIDKVVEAFDNLSNTHLIVTNQGDRTGTLKEPLSPSIEYYNKPLTYKEIEAIYNRVHIVIQVSKQEGLGLGFYEAMEHGKPLLTLDVPLYREIVKDAGWFVPAKEILNLENKEAIVPSYDFYVSDLRQTVQLIVDTYHEQEQERMVERIKQRTKDLNDHTFYERLRLSI